MIRLVDLAIACLATVLPAGEATKRPNIVFIMSDDHAAHALSCYGSVINQTPSLDRLAKDGARLTNCFVTNSICTPSRATMLTGKYSHLNGVPVFNRFDGSQQTVAKLLQASGYYTGIIGKWHLESDPTGFDQWKILPGQGTYVDPVFLSPEGNTKITGHCTDITTDLAIDFLARRPAEKPFFLMLHQKAPHRNWQPTERHRLAWKDRVIPEPASLFADHDGFADAIKLNRQTVADDLDASDLKMALPDTLSGQELTCWKYGRYMQDYLACVQGVDESVGRVLDWLDAQKLSDNTVVIYTSDQGFFLGDHGLFDKRFMYDPSLRVPFLVRWPGTIKPGMVVAAMAINPDFAPTFLAIAGQPVPGDMQGRSLLPVLTGPPPSDWRTSMYYRYYHDPGDHRTAAHYGVRTTTHKLIHFWKQDQWELFDLVTDPQELHNLANDPALTATLATLKSELARLKREVKDDDRFANEQPGQDVDPKTKK